MALRNYLSNPKNFLKKREEKKRKTHIGIKENYWNFIFLTENVPYVYIHIHERTQDYH